MEWKNRNEKHDKERRATDVGKAALTEVISIDKGVYTKVKVSVEGKNRRFEKKVTQ